MENLLFKMKMKVKLETFYKYHVYSGGFSIDNREDLFFTYTEASKPFYKVWN